MNDSNRITNAFRELRKRGWFARKKFWCCQTCGCAGVPKSYKDKFVFYHAQDAQSINEEGNIGCGHSNNPYVGHGEEVVLFMTHGEGGDANEVVTILNKHGLDATWCGDMNKRIQVKHKEQA